MSDGMTKFRTLHRSPGEESIELYPGLVVSDGEHSRQGGSITAGRSRLPLWCFMGLAVKYGYGHEWTTDYAAEQYGWTADRAAEFVSELCDLRGEFGRLLLVLADSERRSKRKAWHDTKRGRKRVREQLLRCLAVIEETPGV